MAPFMVFLNGNDLRNKYILLHGFHECIAFKSLFFGSSNESKSTDKKNKLILNACFRLNNASPFLSSSISSSLISSTVTLPLLSTTQSSFSTFSSSLLPAILKSPLSTPSSTLQSTSFSPSVSGNEMKVMLEDDCRFRPTIENYITIASFCIIFCLSVVGNAVVIIVILQQRSMRSVTNIYLLNLAITDLMLSLVCMPPTLISSVIYCWIFGDLLCKLFAYLQPVVVTASAYTLALIAFERYYAICKPLHSRIWHTRSHAYVMITLVWVISVLANLLMLFMFEQQTYNVNGLTCAPRHQPILHFYYQIYMTSVLLLIPLCIMVLLYGSVIHSLRNGMKMDYVSSAIYNNNTSTLGKHNEQLQQKQCNTQSASISETVHSSNSNNRNSVAFVKPNYLHCFHASRKVLRSNSQSSTLNSTREPLRIFLSKNSLRSTYSERSFMAKQRMIKMLIVIVIIFFCCWTPNYMWWLLLTAQDSFKTFDIWNSQVNTAITVLCYISSCANPITYCFLNKKFRAALLVTFGSKRKNPNQFRTLYMPEMPMTDTPTHTHNIENQVLY